MAYPLQSTLLPLGADVSKLTIDLHLGTEKGRRFHKRIANTLSGFQEAQQWLVEQGALQVHVCAEATGTYSDAFATFMDAQGHRMSVVAPHKMHAFRKSEGQLAKTDPLDARLLALYAAQKQPPAWHPLDDLHIQLKLSLERLDQLEGLKQQEVNRLENQRLSPALREQIQALIAFVEHQKEQANAHMRDLLKQIAQQQRQTSEEALSASERTTTTPPPAKEEPLVLGHKKAVGLACVDHFQEIKGIGLLTAVRMYSLLKTMQEVHSAAQLAAYIGVVPHAATSGTSVRGKAQRRGGNAKARSWLYMSALNSKRFDPDMREWAQQLQARGLCQKQILVAVMHKLVRILFALYTTGQRYDARKAWPTHGSKDASSVMSQVA
ncbi:IS110 family transposase [Tengunoibacter tsumagoiensis]|uniref:IS110 family transposase n=1 Tax=Tengunoibacter tsumagoiensis TaxID=2014871 RepID=A0A402A2R8_9CHLR|nr:IS110 family transposase [Tengunoibacter tsumagoiensis]GCE10203.1 IS110 family transposase [Tengunoibacter tsumagoiensis]GCE13424.1 IS110 family transposase [Tengunoibacter tsumagoiensis]GCE14478.1 IS110 family transposase [Tengunoibacter tsumagoiensis]